jgi:hypothetical protein
MKTNDRDWGVLRALAIGGRLRRCTRRGPKKGAGKGVVFEFCKPAQLLRPGRRKGRLLAQELELGAGMPL